MGSTIIILLDTPDALDNASWVSPLFFLKKIRFSEKFVCGFKFLIKKL
jgi:hypothetical protein